MLITVGLEYLPFEVFEIFRFQSLADEGFDAE